MGVLTLDLVKTHSGLLLPDLSFERAGLLIPRKYLCLKGFGRVACTGASARVA